MKFTFKLFLMTLVAIAGSFDRTCEGRGGGGGGGGRGGFGGGGSFGGGGMSRPMGGNFSRSPSLNGPRDFGSGNFGGYNGANRSQLPNTIGGGNLGGINRPSYPQFNNRIGGENGIRNNTINNNFNRSGNIGDRTNINNFNFNHAGNGNRPINPNHGDWYHGNWNGNWNNNWHGNHPYWHYHPAAWWAAGFWAGAATAAPWSWGYWSYANPYVVEPLIVGDTTIDYSQPLAVAQSGDAQPTDADQAMSLFSTARKAFYSQDYPAALKAAEQALALTPSDAAMNEFRGVTLFAMKNYKDAAGVMYAVLSVGPGWDWTTLSALYPNISVYTSQLRALEEYVKANPDDAAAHFLLAYHYLSCNHTDAAAKQLKRVVALNPQDTLSAQLLAGLTEKTTPPPPVADPAAAAKPAVAKPVDAASLTGSWKADRPDGSAFALTLAADGKFKWKFTQNGKTQEFSGPYTVADNLLILKQNDNPVMVGQVTWLGDNQFNFKLPGENPSDPGLTFSK